MLISPRPWCAKSLSWAATSAGWYRPRSPNGCASMPDEPTPADKFMKPSAFLFTAALLLYGTTASLAAAASTPPQAAIASAHPAATAAGMQVLAAGGNAFDAAVAVSAALAVVEPYSSGLGGGGFWLLHEAENGNDVMIDVREQAPSAANRTMYQDDDGNVIAE